MARSYRHAIAGLLRKRSELEKEAKSVRQRAAEVAGGIDAINRVLACLGYRPALPILKAQCVRDAVSPRAHLSRALLVEMRGSDGLTARKLALRIATQEQRDTSDAQIMGEMTRRVSKSLRRMREHGVVTSGRDELNQFVWQLVRA